jgi:hypothetical protein
VKKLDRSRSFAEVFGSGEPHRYEQDGLKFDGAGDQVMTAAERAESERKTKPTGKAGKADPASPADQVDAQLRG